MSSEKVVPPPISWAQRNDLIYVDIAAECKDIDFKFTEDSMHFKGVDSSSNQKYEVMLNFYSKINPEKILTKNNSRVYEFVIYKKQESQDYWPKLTNDKHKLHFLKVDFNKWKNEGSDDENEGGGAGFDNLDLFSKLNSMDGSNKPSFDDFEDEEDSDDEDLPKLSSEQDDEEEKKSE